MVTVTRLTLGGNRSFRVLTFREIAQTHLRFWSRYKRQRLVSRYKHSITIRPQGNNVFLNTWLPTFTASSYRLSAGLIRDFFGRKKKKTHMAGLELGYLLGSHLKRYQIQRLEYQLKGHGAQKRGVLVGLKRQGLVGISLVDRTPLAHNGTRATKPRRL